MISLLSILCAIYMANHVYTYPTVLMHGVLANKQNMDELKTLLELNFKIPVYNIEIGNGVGTSLFTSMNSQLEILCDTIYKMDELKDGFNFIGMSQGGLLARGYVEYCNKYPVINLITLASPNGGVYYKTQMADFKKEFVSVANAMGLGSSSPLSQEGFPFDKVKFIITNDI